MLINYLRIRHGWLLGWKAGNDENRVKAASEEQKNVTPIS